MYMRRSNAPACAICLDERWVCEQHPDRPWGGDSGCEPEHDASEIAAINSRAHFLTVSSHPKDPVSPGFVACPKSLYCWGYA